jgi:hypothetical protein
MKYGRPSASVELFVTWEGDLEYVWAIRQLKKVRIHVSYIFVGCRNDTPNPIFGAPLLDSGTEYQVQYSVMFMVHFVTVNEIDSIYGPSLPDRLSRRP